MNFTNIKYQIDKEREEKPKLNILIYWATISVLGIIIIKTIIRPKHLLLSDTFDFLQGTLPNFFAGAMFCVLAYVYYIGFYKNGKSIVRRLAFSVLFSFLGLTLWEFIQYFMGDSFDYFDVLMTLVGNVCTILLILLLRIK